METCVDHRVARHRPAVAAASLREHWTHLQGARGEAAHPSTPRPRLSSLAWPPRTPLGRAAHPPTSTTATTAPPAKSSPERPFCMARALRAADPGPCREPKARPHATRRRRAGPTTTGDARSESTTRRRFALAGSIASRLWVPECRGIVGVWRGRTPRRADRARRHAGRASRSVRRALRDSRFSSCSRARRSNDAVFFTQMRIWGRGRVSVRQSTSHRRARIWSSRWRRDPAASGSRARARRDRAGTEPARRSPGTGTPGRRPADDPPGASAGPR